MANVNMNNELGKFNNLKYREDRTKELEAQYGINALRESSIWESTGGKFETVFGVYMTNKQVATFLKSGWDNKNNRSNLLKNYTAPSSEYYNELTECGMKFYSRSELSQLKETFQTPLSEEFENDTTELLSITNRGLVLWHLKAVIRLGMFITGTPAGKPFRDAITNELASNVVNEHVIHDITNDKVEEVLDMIINEHELPAPKAFKNTLKAIKLSCTSIPEIKVALEQLKTLRVTLTDLQTVNDSENFLVAAQYLKLTCELKDELEEIRGNYFEAMVKDLDDDTLYTMTDIAKEVYRKSIRKYKLSETDIRRKLTNKLFNILVDKGILYKQEYTATKRSDGSQVTKYKYMAVDEFDWINKPKYGTLGGQYSDVIRFSKIGKMLVTTLISTNEDDLIGLTDDDFMEYLYLEINNDNNRNK